jgi:hypothetical protein
MRTDESPGQQGYESAKLVGVDSVVRMAKFTVTYTDPHTDPEEVNANSLTEQDASVILTDEDGVVFWASKAAVMKVKRG